MSQRISWTYEHSLNSKSKTWIKKEGLFLREIKHTRKYRSKPGWVQMAKVWFDSNIHPSIVPYDELVFKEKAQ